MKLSVVRAALAAVTWICSIGVKRALGATDEGSARRLVGPETLQIPQELQRDGSAPFEREETEFLTEGSDTLLEKIVVTAGRAERAVRSKGRGEKRRRQQVCDRRGSDGQVSLW